MKRILPLLLVAACGPKIDPGPIPIQVAQQAVPLVERSNPDSPNVYLQAVVAAGSAWDPVGSEGIAALTARSMVDAGAADRTGQEVRDALYPTGNSLEMVVDREWVSIRLRCHRDHAELCVEVFSDVVLAPRFTEADVARLRDQAAHKLSTGYLEDEEALGEEVLHNVLYEGHPYGHPTEGRLGTLALLDAAQLRRFHARHYLRSTVTLGIAGGYHDKHRDALLERFVALVGDMPVDRPLQAPVAVDGRSLVVVSTTTPVTGWHLGHPITLDRTHEDWPAMVVAMTAFGAHRQSFGRLFRRLRTDRGLNYGDYAYVEAYVQRGWSPEPENGVLRRVNHFYIWLRPTSTDNGAFALKAAITELEALVEDGLTAEEFEDTRAYLTRHTRLDARDDGRRLAFALDAAVMGTPNPLDLLPTVLETLTVEQVNAALKRHLRPEDLRIVGVSGDAESLAKALVEETATPIVYADVEPGAEQAEQDAAIAAKVLGVPEDEVWVVPANGVFR